VELLEETNLERILLVLISENLTIMNFFFQSTQSSILLLSFGTCIAVHLLNATKFLAIQVYFCS